MTTLDNKELAKSITKFMMQDAVSTTGLCFSKDYNPLTKTWIDAESTIDDFGDYAPFIYWYGREFKNTHALRFPNKQLFLWQKHLTSSGLYKSPIPSNGNVLPAEHVDYLLGLNHMFMLTKEELYLEEAERIADVLCEIIQYHTGLLPRHIFPNFKAPVRTLCFADNAGAIAENLLDLYELSENEKYLDVARLIIERWTSMPSFRKHGLFIQATHPTYPFLSRLYWHYAKPMKDQTDMAYALIRLCSYERGAKDLLCQLLQRGLPKLATYSGYASWYDFKTGRISDRTEQLTFNHAVMDTYQEAYRATSDALFLNEAERIANVWINRKNDKTGLIAEQHIGISPKLLSCRLASFCDFHTGLLKLAEITRDKRYSLEARKAVKSLQYFMPSKICGLLAHVGVVDGEPCPQPNQIKYAGDALKFLLCQRYADSGGKFYKPRNTVEWYLSRDR